MITNPRKTVKNSLTLVTALFGCGMTLATIAPVYALSKSSVTHTPSLSSSLISKETTPSDTKVEPIGFPVFKSVLKTYSYEQKMQLLNVLKSEQAKNANSVEGLAKIIGDDNLTKAIQKDISNSPQARGPFPWHALIEIINWVINP